MNKFKNRRNFFKYLIIFSSFSFILNIIFFQNLKIKKSKYLYAKDDKKRNWIVNQNDY